MNKAGDGSAAKPARGGGSKRPGGRSRLLRVALVVAAVAAAAGYWLYDGPYVSGSELIGVERMRAAVLHSISDYSSSELGEVRVDEVPLPRVGAHDVLVRVRASSINPVDYKITKGFFRHVDWTGVVPSLPFTPGFDLAGDVAAVGSGVTRVAVGDRVFGMAHFTRLGAFAEYTSIPEAYVARMPASVDYAEAAALPLVGLTSYQALTRHAPVQAGDRVLVIGGAGGTGSLGIMLAKHLGAAEVTTTASSRNVEFVKSIGADVVVNYREQNVTEALAGAGFDVMYDCIGGPEYWPMAADHGVVRPGGSYVTIVGDKSGGAPFSLSKVLATAGKVIQRNLGPISYRMFQTATNGEELEVLAAAVDAGALRAPIDSTYELARIGDALRASAAGRAVGKIVVSM